MVLLRRVIEPNTEGICALVVVGAMVIVAMSGMQMSRDRSRGGGKRVLESDCWMRSALATRTEFKY